MPAKGKHRRLKSSSLTRVIAAACTGGAVLLLPALGATAAHAAQADTAAKPAAAPKTYVVVAGDSLSKIAKQHYGDANKYNLIFEANRPMLEHPDKIYPGQSLRVPPLN